MVWQLTQFPVTFAGDFIGIDIKTKREKNMINVKIAM